jgi:hypothetical protein
VVLRGTLKAEIWDDARTLDVVVKVAFDIEQDPRGEHEFIEGSRHHCVSLKATSDW